MYVTNKTKQNSKIIDLIVLSHYFTFEEYVLTKKVLNSYTPSVWAPMNSGVRSSDVQIQQRSIYHEISNLFEIYSPEWAFSPIEMTFIKEALEHFNNLPLPLYGSMHDIRERKNERKVAKRIIEFIGQIQY